MFNNLVSISFSCHNSCSITLYQSAFYVIIHVQLKEKCKWFVFKACAAAACSFVREYNGRDALPLLNVLSDNLIFLIKKKHWMTTTFYGLVISLQW